MESDLSYVKGTLETKFQDLDFVSENGGFVGYKDGEPEIRVYTSKLDDFVSLVVESYKYMGGILEAMGVFREEICRKEESNGEDRVIKQYFKYG